MLERALQLGFLVPLRAYTYVGKGVRTKANQCLADTEIMKKHKLHIHNAYVHVNYTITTHYMYQ